MKAENEFAAYLTGDRPSCEAAYLNSRLFPAINALAIKARRCARTQLWLTVGECIAALCLPLLALFPFAIPDAALKLALASLGVLIAAALFAQQILHLPQRAADCAAKAERLPSAPPVRDGRAHTLSLLFEPIGRVFVAERIAQTFCEMQRGLVGRVPAGIQAPIQAVQNQLRSTGTAQTTSLDILPCHDFNLDAAGIPGVG